jgi:hypothetical protein
MKSLGAHLQKYSKLGAPQKHILIVCKEVLEKVLGVPIPEKALRVRNEVLETTLPAPIKMKLREMKREVLIELRKRLGSAIRDVI